MSAPLRFLPDSLKALCDSGAWARGLDLYRQHPVRRIAIESQGDAWQIEGLVQGSLRQPYAVSIDLEVLPDGQIDYWRGECSCPVGLQCKHGVALLLQAAAHGGAEVAMPPEPERAGAVPVARHALQARAAEVARLEAEARLLRWMEDWDRAGGLAEAPAPGARPERPEQYLYLLSVIGAPRAAPLLQLEAVVSYPKLTGGWSKPKQIRTPPARGQAVYDRASEADRQVLQLLRAMPSQHGYYTAAAQAPCAVLEGPVGLLTLQQAAQTGALFADAGGSTVGAALQWGPALEVAWQWQEVGPVAGAPDPQWALRPVLPRASVQLGANQPPLYLDVAQGLCGVVEAPGLRPAQLGLLLRAPPLSAVALDKHQAPFMQRLGTALPLPPLWQSLVRIAGQAPVARLHLAPVPPAQVPALGWLTAQLRFDYQGLCGWWEGESPAVLLDGPEGRRLLQRDLVAEQAALQRLADLGLQGLGEGRFAMPDPRPPQDWRHWASEDYAVLRVAGFVLTLDPALQGWMAHAEGLEVDLQPQGSEDATSPWFALSLGMEINGQRHNILPWLPELIAAAAAYAPDPATGPLQLPPYLYLPAPDGPGFVRLPTDALRPWMAALLELVGEGGRHFSGDSLPLSRVEAVRAASALGEGAEGAWTSALRAMVQQLQAQATLPEVPVPASVQADLRPYQRQGLNWLQFLRSHGLAGVLADDMGLGKTLQTLVHIQVEKDAGRLTHPALIIAPVSLMGNWQREAARFCPELRSLVLHGKDRHGVAEALGAHDLVIAPYSLLQRDRERWLQSPWHIVVLDEAQNIKNASTQAAQVVHQLQAHHRLCLSGTPIENHLGEVWSLFHFLMPGYLGSAQRFNTWFRSPIEKSGHAERLAQLRARLAPFMLRRTKALVAHELPPKIETVVPIALAGPQADLYETIRLGMEQTVRAALASKGLARSQITILDALLKLRQVCCDPRLVPLEAAQQVQASAKLAHLMELLPEMLAEGRRILLFSQFTSMLTLIEGELKKRQIPWVKLTGQSQKRDALIERFTSGEVPLFLISLKAGGVGLNLPQADTVIHYDPWWNPAVETQATDRAHRIGQTQSVWVLKLVAQGTIEERILALQERKAALARSLYRGGAESPDRRFTEEDLANLLKPLSNE
ncbi:MAG: DEAD/DEAH box helicase [Burkholderiaceae bacterium]|nr:DEAD/DEAH box helicase [Burkholderiaceae bacterium]